MNKYESFVTEILAQTRSGHLRWNQIGRNENSGIILNDHLVLRQFSTIFVRGDGEFTLLLLEKRQLYDDEDFFDERLEFTRPELLVVEKGELVLSLWDGLVSLVTLMNLLVAAESSSDSLRRLLDVQT